MTARTAWQPHSGIATRLLALVLAVAIPLLIFSAYMIYCSAATARQLTVSSALAVARNVAAATHEFLHASRDVLPQLAARMVVTPAGEVVCDPQLKELNALMPGFVNISVVDKHGRLTCTVLPANRETFRLPPDAGWVETTLRERAPVLSGPRVGLISKKWISTYSQSLMGPDGHAAGMLVVTFDLTAFQPVVRQEELSPGWVAGIVHTDGTIISRSREPEKWIGRSMAIPLQDVVSSDGSTGYAETAGVDGVDRLYAIAHIPDTPWIAYAGIDARAVWAEEREHMIELAALAAVLISIAGIAALVLGRRIATPMRAVADAARAVAAGEPQPDVPVSGPREIREVAREFNRMVEVRRSAEIELRRLADRARDLSYKLAAVEQSERRRIHRELHDRIGQNLALLNLSLDVTVAQLPPACGDAVKPRLSEARTLVQSTIAHVRNVMANLRPPALDEFGLSGALRAYIASYSASTGLTVNFDGADITPRPPLLTEGTLFRIAQEALTNIAKHANAKTVEIQLTATSTTLALRITDDGVGFDLSDQGAARASWGLTTMRERAEAVGANLHIESQPGRGTSIAVTVER